MLIRSVLLLLAVLHFSSGELSALWPAPSLRVFQLPFANYVAHNLSWPWKVPCWSALCCCFWLLCPIVVKRSQPCNLSPLCFSSSCLLLATWLTTASWTWSATALSGCTVSWGRRACTRVRSSNVPLTSSPPPGTRWSPMLSCWRWWSRSSTSFLCCRWALAGCEMGLCPVSDQHMTFRNKYYEGHYLHLEMYLRLCLILFSEPVWVMHKEIVSLASFTWLRPHFSLNWHKNWD